MHNHTIFCNHATGRIEDYIKKAIEKNIKHYGFSEHAPMDFDKSYRLKKSDVLQYVTEIKNFQKKYKEQISIYLGYEVDYIKEHTNKDILNADVDFLIGSVHFLNKWGFDNPEFIAEYKNRDINEIYKEYFKTIKQMVNSRLFDIVGHLDLIKIFNFLPTIDMSSTIKEVLKSIKKSDMVVEINSAGFKKATKEQYPSIDIIKLLKELNIPITFSSDAHSVEQVGYKLDEIIKIAKQIGYKEAVVFKQRDKKIIKI